MNNVRYFLFIRLRRMVALYTECVRIVYVTKSLHVCTFIGKMFRTKTCLCAVSYYTLVVLYILIKIIQ